VPFCLKVHRILNRSFRPVCRRLFILHVLFRVGVGVRIGDMVLLLAHFLELLSTSIGIIGLIVRAKRSSRSYLCSALFVKYNRLIKYDVLSKRARPCMETSAKTRPNLDQQQHSQIPFPDLHVKMSSKAEAVRLSSDILSSFRRVSPTHDVIRDAAGAILQRAPVHASHWRSRRRSNITSPSPRLDQPHTSGLR
jgi:hypothetical protein